MDLYEHFGLMWRERWRILLLSAILAMVTFVRSQGLDEVFMAESQVLATPASAASGQQPTQEESVLLGRRVTDLASTDEVLTETARQAQLDAPVKEVHDRVTATDKAAGLIELTATAPSSSEATTLVQSYANALMAKADAETTAARDAAVAPLRQRLTELEGQIEQVPDNATRTALQAQYQALLGPLAVAESVPRPTVTLLSESSDRPNKVAPTPLRDALLVFVIAFVVNAELLTLRAKSRDRFNARSVAEELPKLTGIPVLSAVPNGRRDVTSEAVRGVRGALSLSKPGGVRSVVLMATGPGAGVTELTARLAIVCAQAGEHVLVVDANLANPDVDPYFKAHLQGGGPPERLAASLFVTQASPVSLGSQTVSGPGLKRLVDNATRGRFVVVDAAPLNGRVDGLVVAAQCDATILVVDPTSRRRSVVSAVDSFAAADLTIAGFVINRFDSRPSLIRWVSRLTARTRPARRTPHVSSSAPTSYGLDPAEVTETRGQLVASPRPPTNGHTDVRVPLGSTPGGAGGRGLPGPGDAESHLEES